MAANSCADAAYYVLELFPTTDESRAQYEKALGGTQRDFPENENAGFDLFCAKDQPVPAEGSATLLDLGVKARMTRFWPSCRQGNSIQRSDTCHFWLAPRSSIWKNGVTQANSLGVIDRSQRGVLMGAVLPISTNKVIQKGSRLFQVLAPDMGHIRSVVLKPLSEIDVTSRGEGGFGSTGR